MARCVADARRRIRLGSGSWPARARARAGECPSNAMVRLSRRLPGLTSTGSGAGMRRPSLAGGTGTARPSAGTRWPCLARGTWTARPGAGVWRPRLARGGRTARPGARSQGGVGRRRPGAPRPRPVSSGRRVMMRWSACVRDRPSVSPGRSRSPGPVRRREVGGRRDVCLRPVAVRPLAQGGLVVLCDDTTPFPSINCGLNRCRESWLIRNDSLGRLVTIVGHCVRLKDDSFRCPDSIGVCCKRLERIVCWSVTGGAYW